MTQCISPVKLGHGAVSCGQCMPCRISAKRKQAAKILLEAAATRDSAFVTFTYKDEHQPVTVDGVPTLRKAEAKELIQKVASALAIRRSQFRHYTVGEYGENTGRPHLHAMWFGINWYDAWNIAEKVWKKGFVQAVACTATRAEYIAGYCTKKLTKEDDERLCEGQEPEFKYQTHQPGLGMSYIQSIIEWYQTESGAAALADAGDIAHQFRFRGSLYPLSDYAKRKIRRALAIPETVEGLREIRPDVHPVNVPPSLEELEERRIRHRQKEQRHAIYAQKYQNRI